MQNESVKIFCRKPSYFALCKNWPLTPRNTLLHSAMNGSADRRKKEGGEHLWPFSHLWPEFYYLLFTIIMWLVCLSSSSPGWRSWALTRTEAQCASASCWGCAIMSPSHSVSCSSLFNLLQNYQVVLKETLASGANEVINMQRFTLTMSASSSIQPKRVMLCTSQCHTVP